MKQSKDLAELIGSMSKQEKRYFKLFTGARSKNGGNKYSLLFDAFDKAGPAVDEEEIRRSLPHAPAPSHFATAKYDLTNCILNSLAAYHAEKSVDAKLRNYLAHIEILYNRGLHEHCRKVIARARRKAEEYQKHSRLIDILGWERKLLLRHAEGKFASALKQFHREQVKVLESISTIIRYEELADRVQEANRGFVRLRDTQALARLSALMDSPQANADPGELPFHACLKLLQSKGNYERFRGNIDAAMQWYAQAVEAWEANAAFIADDPDNYKRFVTNYLSCAIAVRKFDDFAESLQKIKQLPSITAEAELTMFGVATYLELGYYLNYGLLEEGRALAAEFERAAPRYAARLRPDRLINLYYNCSMVYFLSGRYEKSLRHILEIINERRAELKRDIQEHTRIMLLVLHYELQNFDVLESIIRSARRYLNERERAREYENAVMAAVAKLMCTVDSAAAGKIFRQLRGTLLGLAQSGFDAQPLGYIELLFWIESKLIKQPIDVIYTSRMHTGRDKTIQELFTQEAGDASV